jgi:acetyl esterase/lipase
LVSGAVALALFAASAAAPSAASVGAAVPVRYFDPVFKTVNLRSDIVYGHAVNQNDVRQELLLDLYTPRGDTLTSRPAIIWVHGGGFSGGDKRSPELVDEANEFARKGYVNVSINYRLAPEGCVGSPGESCIIGIVQAMQDGQTAVRFLRARAAKYGIDPTRIAIGGSSAGAITALNVGYNASHPGPGGHQEQASAVEAVQSLSGAAILTAPGPDGAPALLFHGTADPLVPYAWAQATVNDAHAAGLVAILKTWVDEGHVPYLQHRTQILNQTRNFFYKHLDLVHAPV